MVANRKPQRMTVDEWRELERNSHDIKHEYVNGWAYPVLGGSLSYSRVGINTALRLEDALESIGKTCYVYNSSVVTRVSSLCYTYADASVSCDERDRPSGETDIFYPRVVVEVLSDSTEAYDRGEKFFLYRSSSTL